MRTPGAGTEHRQQRAAKNQALFREVNERIEPINQAFALVNRINDFVCECADETCTDHIKLSLDEYEALRRHPNRFAVIPDDAHVWSDLELIVEKTDRFWVLEKIGHGGAIARELDPRARSGD